MNETIGLKGKPGLRPIVSFIDSPTYMLSKHLAQILSPLMGNTDFTVKNSVEFCEQMKNVSLKEDEELVSFDVVSLFTSIPVELAIQVAKDLLSNDVTLQDRSTIPVSDIVDLLDFCLSTTNFKYNNNHYQQIFGTAMGSPVSAVMANLVMEDLEKRALSTSLSQPCFWKRYVDDVCAAVKSNLVLTLQNHLNSIEPSIQFTVERETERKISFLDVTVCRQDDGQLSTKVYRKPTHTERYLSFDSHHPAAHKRAVVKSLTDRAKTIPSSVDQQSKEMQHVTAALRANGYPKRFVIDVSKPKRPSQQTPATAPDDKKGFCILPYIKGYQPGVNETTVNTASSPVVYKNDKKQVVAAVAGMQFDEDKMKETFQEVIANNECNNTEEYFCRLIDDDGFILATNRPDNAEVGKFFGVWEGAVLKKFIDQTLFKNLTFGNVQGECKKPEPDASSARTLLNPLFAVTSYVQFWTQTVFWSLMQFNIYSFFSRSNVALAEVEEKKVPCTQKLKFYKGVWENRTTDKPEALSCPDSNGCDWPVFMAAVDGTNLRLVVVVKRQCKCDDNDNKKLTTKPEDLPIIPTPRALSYRKPPESTSFCNEELEEGKPPCAMASLASPQSITVIFLLILAFLIPCNDRWR
ncbi:hypothetical protein ACROYT_G017705 [Oculina patagonica]